MSVEQTRSRAAELPRIFQLLRHERAVFDQWERLVARYDVKGRNTHDARIVAAMRRHQITHVLAFDATDFNRFDQITVLNAARRH